MNTHNIQTDKLNLITWITQLQDTTLIEKLKKIQAATAEDDFIVPEWQKNIVGKGLKTLSQKITFRGKKLKIN